MESYRLLLEYDGTRFVGWQRQPNGLSVQQVLEEALESLAGHPLRVHASGRTDAGVHALGQVVRVDLARVSLGPEGLLRGGNSALPEDVRIRSVEPCRASFDPRRDARRRWYRYGICGGQVGPALGRHYLWHVPCVVDWGRVEGALDVLRGEHEFSAFRSSACGAVRTVLDLEEARHEVVDTIHYLHFRCRSFLHNMVRFLVGAVLTVGQGRVGLDDLRLMLRTGHRDVSFRVAPPQGLVLMEVWYPE